MGNISVTLAESRANIKPCVQVSLFDQSRTSAVTVGCFASGGKLIDKRPRTGSSLQDQMLRLPGHLYWWDRQKFKRTTPTEHKRATRNGDINNHTAEHHLQTNHRNDWDSAKCITYSTNYYQDLSTTHSGKLRCLQLPSPNKRPIDSINETDKQ